MQEIQSSSILLAFLPPPSSEKTNGNHKRCSYNFHHQRFSHSGLYFYFSSNFQCVALSDTILPPWKCRDRRGSATIVFSLSLKSYQNVCFYSTIISPHPSDPPPYFVRDIDDSIKSMHALTSNDRPVLRVLDSTMTHAQTGG